MKSLINSFSIVGSLVVFLGIGIFVGISTIPHAQATEGGGEVLYEDDVDPACINYIVEAPGAGLDGSNALELDPDPWHKPVYKLYCGGGTRRDFRPYDVLEFYFRSPEADPGDPTFYVRTWDKIGNTVPIRNYITSGVIDNTWRLVSIPLEDLATDDWDLGNVESLVWSKDSDRRTYYVDRIVLREISAPELISSEEGSPFWESNTVVRLTFSKRYDEETIRDLTNYSLESGSDPAYSSPTSPIDTGMLYRVTGFSSTGSAEIRYEVFLKFPAPLQNGHTYSLSVQGITDESGNIMNPAQVDFVYDDSKTVNPNVKINQVGYLPNAPKIGYVGGYVGDLGGGAWAVGGKGALFVWDDQKGWEQVSPLVSSTLRAVAATSEDDVWCVGDAGTILHWDGSTWSQVESPTSKKLYAIHMGPTNIGWAVGEDGVSLRYENGTWTLVSTSTSHDLYGVWAGPNDTAWAVGKKGTIIYWNGSEWIADEHPVDDSLLAIHGPHEDWLWAVGASGTVLQRQYGHWNVFEDTPGTTRKLRTVITDPSGQVWIGGDKGILWHKPGFGSSAFVAVDSGTSSNIFGLARQHGRRFFGVGKKGEIITSDGSTWESAGKLGSNTLRGVFALPYGVLRIPQPEPAVSIKKADTLETVLTVPLKLEAANWELSGEDVFSFDFSSLTAPGSYLAYVPGLGVSEVFEVGDGVLHNAAYTTARGLYYQRCGTAISTPYAEESYVRPAGHTSDAIFHDSVGSSLLASGEVPGEAIDAHGGWHDAGDFGKYMPTAAAALWYLFTAYDMDPARFTDGAWNIPESGNGVPDLLDEARWELDWIARMQASDGGIYHKLTSLNWFEGMPQDESTTRYIFEKTTHDTALGAAVFAAAARLWAPYDAGLAEQYLERAERAWSFLQNWSDPVPQDGFQNPSDTCTGEYNDNDDSDNRLWAAAELYRTTGKAEYQDYFETWWADNQHEWGWNNWQHFYQCAYWAYLRAQWDSGKSSIKEEIREHIIRDADEAIEFTYSNPYRNAARLDVPEWIGWGTFTQSSEYSFILLQAWFLEKDQRYLDAALLNLDAQLGANPLSLSFITGLGERFPLDPLHMVSIYDGAEVPVPGIPVFGVAAHLSNDNSYNIASQSDANNYPFRNEVMDPYPILRRYVDAHELVAMSEFTIVDMAISAGVFGLLDGYSGN